MRCELPPAQSPCGALGAEDKALCDVFSIHTVISLFAVATHWQLVAVMCFRSCMSRLLYEYTTSQHPPAAPHTHTYRGTHAPTYTHLNTQMHAYLHMHVCTHPLTLTQQVGLRLSDHLSQIIMLYGWKEFLFNPTLPGLILCQSLGLSSWLYPSSRDTAEI